MKRRSISLAVRLTVSIGTIITILLLSFGWLVERSINAHFIQQDVDELNAVVQALEHTIALMPANESAQARQQRFANAVSGHHNAQYRVSTARGAVIFSTPYSDLAHIAKTVQPVEQITTDNVAIWQAQGETFRGAVLQFTPAIEPTLGALTLTVATEIDFHLHYLESLRHHLRLVMVIALLIAIFATWLAVYQGHAPIRRISEQIRKIRSDQLHIRLETTSVPAELVGLAMSFNEMLDGLEEGFQRLSHFSADLAHEIRTPITNMKTQTEVGLSRARNIEAYREILYSNLEEYERMAKMVNDMLFLAQADNQLLKIEPAPLDIATEVRLLFDYFEALAEEQGVTLQLVGRSVQAVGDRLMLRRALSNLLSNAIRYTPVGHTVTVRLEATTATIKIAIQNPGPMISARHLPHIFERFYRTDASRQRCSEGTGLGLPITKSIIEAHQGHITVSSSVKKTVFEVYLPSSKP